MTWDWIILSAGIAVLVAVWVRSGGPWRPA